MSLKRAPKEQVFFFPVIKQPWETYYLGIDYGGIIGTRTVVTIEPSATLDGVDATADLLDITDTVASGEFVYFRVIEKTDITPGTYKIDVRSTLSDADQLEDEGYLVVKGI